MDFKGDNSYHIIMVMNWESKKQTNKLLKKKEKEKKDNLLISKLGLYSP